MLADAVISSIGKDAFVEICHLSKSNVLANYDWSSHTV